MWHLKSLELNILQNVIYEVLGLFSLFFSQEKYRINLSIKESFTVKFKKEKLIFQVKYGMQLIHLQENF